MKTVDGDFTATCVITVNRESPPMPSEVIDVITYQSYSLEKDGYSSADIKNTVSGAEYNICANSKVKYIQLRTRDGNEGFVCTKSAGSVSKITVTFMDPAGSIKNGNDAAIYIYGSNEAYSSPADLYANGLTPLAQLAYNDGKVQSYTFESDFKYFGIRSVSGTVYMDEIAIEWGAFEQKATTRLAIDPKTAQVAVGATVKLNVQRDGNDALVWKSMDEKIATVANGVVTGVAEGVVKIAATANNISDTCVVTVIKSSDIPTKTIAEFIAAKGGKCLLTGVVSNIKKNNDGSYNKYGNFDLTDASGNIYVYGLLTASGEKQKFQELGVDEGDTLTIIAENYKLYKETDEVEDAIFVSVKKAGGVGPTPHGDPLDIDYAEAAYVVDEEGAFWYLFGGKYPQDEAQEYLDYPIIELYIANEDDKHLAGTYDLYGGYLYTSDNDSVEFVAGSIYVACIEAGNELYAPYYTIVATLYDEEGNEYVYEFSTEVIAYDYETGEDIELDDQPTQGIENTVVYEFDPNAPIYNIQGMQVDRNTRGILIQNGHKFIINGL